MQEAQRFLRYVVPGLIFIIELLIYLLFAQDICLDQVIHVGGSISVPITAFLASGGLGFLFGVFYYTLIWKAPFYRLGVDHRPLLKDSVAQGWLQLRYKSDDRDNIVDELSQRGAWRLVLSYWSTRLELSKELKGAAPRADRLADIAHSLGTTFVASILAFIIFVILHIQHSSGLFCNDLYYLFFLFIPFFHCWNFIDVIKDHEDNVYLVIINELKNKFKEDGRSTILYVSSKDLTPKV